MYFPSDFEQKLGFDTIRQILYSHCLSSLGRSRVDKITCSTAETEIYTWLTQTAELKQILQFEENFPSQDYYDLIPELLRIHIPGTYMETDRISELRLSVTTITNLISFISDKKEKFPCLFGMINGSGVSSTVFQLSAFVPFFISMVDRIDRFLDDKSAIRDSASPELHRIRKEKASLQAAVERKIVQSFKLARQSGWTPEDAEVTIRNGRLVISLVSTHKRKIQGFLHDESATGHTVYVEPAEIFETNNEIRELDYAERREIIRILLAFASYLRPEIEPLIHAYQFLGQIDFLRAKAMFAISVNASAPINQIQNLKSKIQIPKTEIRKPKSFSWHQAIHPLLFLSHKKQNREIVPLDIEMNPDQRILIVSGPNAGGKSVCLKTVGLLQYMFQCGLLPAVREDSEFCIFQKIFIDIGDEQSIDNDLSTYSSKLFNLKFFIENTDENSLFLIDELGTGTDPSLGGAIAEATLEELNSKSAMGIVTTHYSNLKLLAGHQKGIINGAMLFDLKKLKPLYKLKTGNPGSSFALEIAQEIGFPESVLKNAKNKTGKSQLDFDRELQNLEVDKQEINQKYSEIKVADEFLAELIKKYEKLTTDLELKKKEIIEKARDEAKKLLDNSNKIIEKTIKEIRESQAEKSRTKEIRAELSVIKNNLLQESLSVKKDPGAESKPFTTTIQHPGSPSKHPYQSYINDLQSKLTNYPLTLDLRGKRVDEALALLQRYIDDAILLTIPEVQILHGKGNGVLRQVTRDYLRAQKEVKSARDANIDQGGTGITIVNFR